MRGKRTPPERICLILASWVLTNSYAETARKLNMSARTVEKLVKEYKDKKDYTEICEIMRAYRDETLSQMENIIISNYIAESGNFLTRGYYKHL